MALFTRIFKRKEALTPAQKIAGLKQLGQEALLKTVREETDESVKIAALQQLAFSDELLQMATQSPSHPMETHARKRLGALLNSGELTLETLTAKVPDAPTLLTLCGYSSDAGHTMVAQTEDEQTLLSIACQAATTQIRQAAAEKIHSQEALLALLKAAKDKDKSVYKLAKTRLDVFKEQRAQTATLNQQADALVHQAELLAKRDIDEVFYARKEQIEAAWAQLNASQLDPTIAGNFHAAIALSDQKLQSHLSAQASLAAQQQRERDAKADLINNLEAMQTHLLSLLENPDLGSAHQQLESLANQHEQALLKAQKNSVSTQIESTRFQQLKSGAEQLQSLVAQHGTLAQLIDQLRHADDQQGHALKRIISAFLSQTQLIKNTASVPVLATAQTALSQWQSERQAKSEQLRDAANDCFDLLRKGNGALRNGQVRRAKAIFSEIETKLGAIAQPSAALVKKFDEFKAGIERLGDWHQFAVTPKKLALIEQMQALIGLQAPPQDIADKVKELQEQWRQLSRGGQNDDAQLWEQFQQAGQQAYEPCKQFFAEQTRNREQNLNNRQQLVDQLQQYIDGYDWEQANWSDVEKTLRLAREAWQSYWPVERKLNKPVQDRFETLADAIYQKLNAEFERNRVKKQNIVSRAQALTEAEDTQGAINSAKQLQQEWQAIGRCKPRADQELWQNFRHHCDTIFDRRKQESQAEQQEREAAKSEAENLIQQLRALLALNGEEFLQARHQAEPLADAFKGLSELPRAQAKGLNQAFNQALNQLHKKVEQEQLAKQARTWREVLATFRKLMALERSDAQALDNLKTEVEQTLESAGHWPSQCVAQLEQRLQQPPATTNEEQALAALRLICIRSEIATGKPSPDMDRALRMEYQVNQLQQGLGTQNPDLNADFETLLLAWISAPAVSDAAYLPLEQRLLDTWQLSSTANTPSASTEDSAPATP